MGKLFRPVKSVAADFIPIFARGRYHLFYLRDWRDRAVHGRGTPWHQIVTDDFVTFDDWGEALPRGPEGSQDLWVFTGSAIETQDRFYIYYTGHNGDFANTDRPQEMILRATSPDLKTWTKDVDFRIEPAPGYERDDWRDPFVYFDERYGQYAMLLASRRTNGPSRNRGCTALLTSPDLQTWTVCEPLWSPNLYFTHECPDLFQIGEWWYLVYSTFSERCVTHYRMSRTLDGPWLIPDAPDGGDTFDGRAYYAAKSASDGASRFLFGWLPTRDGDTDSGGYQWGGNLVVHEIVQAPSGALSVRVPDTVAAQYTQPKETTFEVLLGSWTSSAHDLRANGLGRLCAASLGSLPAECFAEITITYAAPIATFGINLRADRDLDNYYQLRFEPAAQRVVFDRWPRPGDVPFSIERPVRMAPNEPIIVKLLVDASCLVAYINDRVALSSRMYDHVEGNWGIFAAEGDAAFSRIHLRA